MSLLTPVDAVSDSGLVVFLLVISSSLGSSPPRTSGLSDSTSLCLCGSNLYPATSESVLFPSDEESENLPYYLRSFDFVSAKSQRRPTELPKSSTTTTGLSVAGPPIRHCYSKMAFSIDFLWLNVLHFFSAKPRTLKCY